jgi:hypothetical protein
MKFVLVNERTPRPKSFCAMCCEPINRGYLRDVTTRRCYCGHACYAAHCEVSPAALNYHAKAS